MAIVALNTGFLFDPMKFAVTVVVRITDVMQRTGPVTIKLLRGTPSTKVVLMMLVMKNVASHDD